MNKRIKYYYIKERINPQFEKPYYMAYGQLTKKQAKDLEKALYGYNVMQPYATEEDYLKAIEDLKNRGLSVR